MSEEHDDTSLEFLLARAANPLNKELDLDALVAFHNAMVVEMEGPQIALNFLAHRIQSTLEKESIMALLVLEECVRKSNPRFINEVGKFRFLNELIKVVSPKYLGSRTPIRVKQKILELLFKWSVELKQEAKINEAYQMLRKQGVVVEDPVYVLEEYELPEAPSPRPPSGIFDDGEKSELLHKLLQSKKAEDLQAANRLIKNMVKDADRRMELMARTMTELEAVNSNAKVLSDMLDNYQVGQTSEEDRDLMKDLFDSCNVLRPKLFRLAGEMDERDNGLDDILKANDELTSVINKYRQAMGLEGEHPSTQTTSLMDLGSPVQTMSSQALLASDTSLLDEQLLNLGLNDVKLPQEPQTSSTSKTMNILSDLDGVFTSSPSIPGILPSYLEGTSLLKPESTPLAPHPVAISSNQTGTGLPLAESGISKSLSGLAELDVLSQSLLKQSLGPNGNKMEFPSTPLKISMSQLRQSKGVVNPVLPAEGSFTATQYTSSTSSPSKGNDPFTLGDLFVQLESIQPGPLPPVTLYDKEGLTVVVHIGGTSPRPDVTVMVVSTINRNTTHPLQNVKFQAAVPKSMKLKLQPPSATSLPLHNPILPTAAITQVMLLANPNQDKVRLKYKISYDINSESRVDIGEVENLLNR